MVGVGSFGIGFDPTPSSWIPGMCDTDLETDLGAVVVGFDNQVSFHKLARACSYAKQKDCFLIASNADETFPHRNPKVVVSGPGAYVAAIEAVTGKEAIALEKPYILL